jgi:hypothetical protein
MTLNETWKNCLRMWKWIVEQIDDDTDNLCLTVCLKVDFLNKYHFKKEIKSDCFFCEYDDSRNGDNCNKCPGFLVDPTFSCMDPVYGFHRNPQLFYKKLLRLNARRNTTLLKKKKG